jgi:hypothetical protein
MKTLLLTLSLATAAVSTSQAEIYRPSIVRDTTVLGAVAGALIGGHNNDRWAEGAVIGAAAGAVLGTVVDQSRPVVYQQREIRPVEVAPCAPVIVAPAPRVVYVNPAPARVVYVNPYPRAVYVRRPVVYVSNSRHYGHVDRRGHNRRW